MRVPRALRQCRFNGGGRDVSSPLRVPGERMSSSVETLVNKEYKYGFITDIESDAAPKGLNEDIIRLISAKKGEPGWLLDWRLKAFRGWLKMAEPHSWPNIRYNP